jgi:hypothetical protein
VLDGPNQSDGGGPAGVVEGILGRMESRPGVEGGVEPGEGTRNMFAVNWAG